MTKRKAKGAKGAGASSKPPKPGEKPPKKKGEKDQAPVSSKIEPQPSDEVKIDVTPPEAKGVGFLEGLLSLKEDPGPEGAEPKKKKRGRPPKPKGLKLEPSELANLLLVPGLLMAANHYLPEAVWPTDEEALAFCGPPARIIVRHMPTIPMSADAMDLGKMMIAGMSWWMRVKPIAEELKAAEAENPEGVKGGTSSALKEGSDDGRYRTEAGTDQESTSDVISGKPGRVGLAAGGSETPG